MTKFFNKFKKLFGPQKTSYGFLAPHQNLEKTNAAIPRKHPGRK